MSAPVVARGVLLIGPDWIARSSCGNDNWSATFQLVQATKIIVPDISGMYYADYVAWADEVFGPREYSVIDVSGFPYHAHPFLFEDS